MFFQCFGREGVRALFDADRTIQVATGAPEAEGQRRPSERQLVDSYVYIYIYIYICMYIWMHVELFVRIRMHVEMFVRIRIHIRIPTPIRNTHTHCVISNKREVHNSREKRYLWWP